MGYNHISVQNLPMLILDLTAKSHGHFDCWTGPTIRYSDECILHKLGAMSWNQLPLAIDADLKVHSVNFDRFICPMPFLEDHYWTHVCLLIFLTLFQDLITTWINTTSNNRRRLRVNEILSQMTLASRCKGKVRFSYLLQY